MTAKERRALKRAIWSMQEQRRARIARRYRLLEILRGYEAWREATGRPIARWDG